MLRIDLQDLIQIANPLMNEMKNHDLKALCLPNCSVVCHLVCVLTHIFSQLCCAGLYCFLLFNVP